MGLTASRFNNQQAKFQVPTAKMGQALSSCVPCLGNDHDAAPSVNEAEMEYVAKENERQWVEKIRTNEDKIVLAVDPKFAEEKIDQNRTEILENLRNQPFGYYNFPQLCTE